MAKKPGLASFGKAQKKHLICDRANKDSGFVRSIGILALICTLFLIGGSPAPSAFGADVDSTAQAYLSADPAGRQRLRGVAQQNLDQSRKSQNQDGFAQAMKRLLLYDQLDQPGAQRGPRAQRNPPEQASPAREVPDLSRLGMPELVKIYEANIDLLKKNQDQNNECIDRKLETKQCHEIFALVKQALSRINSVRDAMARTPAKPYNYERPLEFLGNEQTEERGCRYTTPSGSTRLKC